MEWAGSVDQGFVELAVDAESLQGRGEVAGGPGSPELARRPEFDGRLLSDQQVWIGGVRPASSAARPETSLGQLRRALGVGGGEVVHGGLLGDPEESHQPTELVRDCG